MSANHHEGARQGARDRYQASRRAPGCAHRATRWPRAVQLEILLNSRSSKRLNADALQGPDAAPDDASRTGMARTLVRPQVATRDEVEAFKRKLARQRWLGTRTDCPDRGGFPVRRRCASTSVQRHCRRSDGFEREPNNQIHESLDMPLGVDGQGAIGKRIDQEHGDRTSTGSCAPRCPNPFHRLESASEHAVVMWVYRSGQPNPMRSCAEDAPAWRCRRQPTAWNLTPTRSRSCRIAIPTAQRHPPSCSRTSRTLLAQGRRRLGRPVVRSGAR